MHTDTVLKNVPHTCALCGSKMDGEGRTLRCPGCLEKREEWRALRTENAALRKLAEAQHETLQAQSSLESALGGLVHGLLKVIGDLGYDMDSAGKESALLEKLIAHVDRTKDATAQAWSELQALEKGGH